MSVAHHDPLAASRRLTGFLLFVLGVGLTVGLYYVTMRARTARDDVQALERRIADERAAIRVLRAEIAYLESPARLERLAATQLALAPIHPDRIVGEAAIFAIPLRGPLRAPLRGSPTPEVAPDE